jgi:hypothetical protein
MSGWRRPGTSTRGTFPRHVGMHPSTTRHSSSAGSRCSDSCACSRTGRLWEIAHNGGRRTSTVRPVEKRPAGGTRARTARHGSALPAGPGAAFAPTGHQSDRRLLSRRIRRGGRRAPGHFQQGLGSDGAVPANSGRVTGAGRSNRDCFATSEAQASPAFSWVAPTLFI